MLTVLAEPPVCAAGTEAPIKRIEPPEHGFYAKVLDCDGILIKAPEEVSDAAVREAGRRISRLLEHLPVVRVNLAAFGAEHHIIGKDQQTSDLPEWRQMKGKMHWDGSMSFDQRTRGMGGLQSSSGEENLLKLPSDRYKDHRDICSHEFSHGIFGSGITTNVGRLFDEQRKRSTSKGLWKSYAGTNTDEFFAELTMWYFGTRGDFGSIRPKPEAGRAWFRRYDPDAFKLFDDFYSGRIPVERVEAVRVPLEKEPGVPASVKLDDSIRSLAIVDNRTDADITTFWRDETGGWRKMDTIPPGAKYDITTELGRVWKIADANDSPLGYFVCRRETTIVVVGGPRGVATASRRTAK